MRHIIDICRSSGSVRYILFSITICILLFGLVGDLSTLHTHALIPANCVTSAVCTICFQEIGIPLGHAIVAATCTEGQYCVRCHESFGTPLGHVLVDATCTERQYCSRCSEIFGEPLGHTVIEATCTTGAYCSRCGKEFDESLGHTIVDATCTRTAYCSRCKEAFGEPLGHVMVQATCTEKSYCSRCKRKFGRALGHRASVATCTEPSVCKRCHVVLSAAMGHTYQLTSEKKPSCTEWGWRQYICDVCQDICYTFVQLTGHKLQWNGYHATCTTCDYRRVQIPVEKLYQGTQYPNGCESVSTVMALQTVGMNVSVETFITEHLPMASLPVFFSPNPIAEDPAEAFIGDPRSIKGLYCFAPVIETAVNQLIDPQKYICTRHQDRSLAELCRSYLDHGIPVVLWATVDMQLLQHNGLRWQIKDTNEMHDMISNLHCVLLVGYDEAFYYIQDPLYGAVSYEKKRVETAYTAMGKQAITIVHKDR